MSSIPVKTGEPISLNVTVTGKQTDKVVRATLYDLSDDSVISGPHVLAHVSTGVYTNNSQTYPSGVDEILAKYEIFESDGTTPNLDGDEVVSDIFYDRDKIVGDINVGANAVIIGGIDAEMENTTDQINAEIDSVSEITATVED